MTEIGYADTTDLDVIAHKITDAVEEALLPEGQYAAQAGYSGCIRTACRMPAATTPEKPDAVLYPDFSKSQNHRRSWHSSALLDRARQCVCAFCCSCRCTW